MTDALLIIGVIAAGGFLVVSFGESALRPGYEASYHTVSELTLGARGWVQVANFIQMGLGMFAFALGVGRALENTIGAVLLAVFALGSIVAGIFRPDPFRNYPPDDAGEVTWRGQVHNTTGPLMFMALFAACLVSAGSFEGPWRIYTLATAVVGLFLTGGTVAALRRDAARTGLVQRASILVYWTWIILTGLYLVFVQSPQTTAAGTVPSDAVPEWAASVLASAQGLEVTSSAGTKVYASYDGPVGVIVQDVEDRFEGARSFQMRERTLLAVPWDDTSMVEVLFTPADESTWDVEARLVPKRAGRDSSD